MLLDKHASAKALGKRELKKSGLAADVLAPFSAAHKEMVRERFVEFRTRNEEDSRKVP